MVCGPRTSADVIQAALVVPPLELIITPLQPVIAAALPPCGVSVKLTVPARATLPDGLGVTVAVNVTGPFTVEGFADDPMVTEVLA